MILYDTEYLFPTRYIWAEKHATSILEYISNIVKDIIVNEIYLAERPNADD